MGSTNPGERDDRIELRHLFGIEENEEEKEQENDIEEDDVEENNNIGKDNAEEVDVDEKENERHEDVEAGEDDPEQQRDDDEPDRAIVEGPVEDDPEGSDEPVENKAKEIGGPVEKNSEGERDACRDDQGEAAPPPAPQAGPGHASTSPAGEGPPADAPRRRTAAQDPAFRKPRRKGAGRARGRAGRLPGSQDGRNAEVAPTWDLTWHSRTVRGTGGVDHVIRVAAVRVETDDSRGPPLWVAHHHRADRPTTGQMIAGDYPPVPAAVFNRAFDGLARVRAVVRDLQGSDPVGADRNHKAPSHGAQQKRAALRWFPWSILSATLVVGRRSRRSRARA